MNDRSADLAFASIHDLAPKIERGEVSPVELTEIALERTQKLNPELNAFIDLWRDESLEAARQAETQIANGEYRGPMHGIPVGLKDLVDVCGQSDDWRFESLAIQHRGSKRYRYR